MERPQPIDVDPVQLLRPFAPPSTIGSLAQLSITGVAFAALFFSALVLAEKVGYAAASSSFRPLGCSCCEF